MLVYIRGAGNSVILILVPKKVEIQPETFDPSQKANESPTVRAETAPPDACTPPSILSYINIYLYVPIKRIELPPYDLQLPGQSKSMVDGQHGAACRPHGGGEHTDVNRPVAVGLAVWASTTHYQLMNVCVCRSRTVMVSVVIMVMVWYCKYDIWVIKEECDFVMVMNQSASNDTSTT